MLDKEKSYGEVFGLSAVKYEQDGKLFNAELKHCDEDGKPKRKSNKPFKSLEPLADTEVQSE